MSFFDDIAEYCKNQLLFQGYNLDTKSARDIIYIFMNQYHRKIKKNPRKLYFSQELKDSLPIEHKNGFDLLCEKIKKGESLQEHQSKGVSKIYNDSLLNDWFVHHFHLGSKSHSGFIERTSSVLMVMVFPDDFYAIKIYPHKNWAKQEMIKIAYNNWPDMFKERFSHYNYYHPPLLDAEIEEYRKKHIIYPVVMDDGSRYWMGGGYMLNGESMKICYKLIMLKASCDDLEKWLLENKIHIIKEAESKRISFASTHEFFLTHNGSEFKLVEKLSGIGFNIDVIDNKLKTLNKLLEE